MKLALLLLLVGCGGSSALDAGVDAGPSRPPFDFSQCWSCPDSVTGAMRCADDVTVQQCVPSPCERLGGGLWGGGRWETVTTCSGSDTCSEGVCVAH